MYRSQNEAYLAECALKGIPEGDCNLLEKLWSDFKTVKFSWILVVLLLFTLSNYLRADRWKNMLSSLGHHPSLWNCWMSIMVGYFANLGLPRMGEILRPVTLSKYEEVPFEKAFGTIVSERLIDVLCLLICIVLMLILGGPDIWAYMRDNAQLDISLLYILAGVGLVGLVTGGIVLRYLWKQNTPFIAKIKARIIGFVDGIRSIGLVENKVLFIGQSIGIWICYYLMTFLCFNAYEPTAHLGPTAGLVAFVFGSLGIVFPSPGGMGSYHFLITQALLLYGIGNLEAFAFANIIFFSIVIACNVLLGLISLIGLPIYNRK